MFIQYISSWKERAPWNIKALVWKSPTNNDRSFSLRIASKKCASRIDVSIWRSQLMVATQSTEIQTAIATFCSTLQHTASATVTHCNTLQHWTRAQLNTLQHTATPFDTPTHGCNSNHRNRVRGKISPSVKHLSLARIFACWEADGDARARGDGVSPNDVAGRAGRHRGKHVFALYGDSLSSGLCLPCNHTGLGGGGGGGEALWPCTQARQDASACQRCFSENLRQTACSHGRHDASFDDFDAGLSESGLCWETVCACVCACVCGCVRVCVSERPITRDNRINRSSDNAWSATTCRLPINFHLFSNEPYKINAHVRKRLSNFGSLQNATTSFDCPVSSVDGLWKC